MSVQRHKIPTVLGEAAALLHRQYRARGIVGAEPGELHHSRWLTYGPDSVLFEFTRSTPDPQTLKPSDPNTPTIAGAMAAIGDSPRGLPLDEVYPAQLATLRAHKLRLVELGYFATDGLERPELETLLLDVTDYLWHMDYDLAICGIHPRREFLYHRYLGMTRLALPTVFPDSQIPVILLGLTAHQGSKGTLVQKYLTQHPAAAAWLAAHPPIQIPDLNPHSKELRT
ncbi:MAG: hypothetical protein WCI73_03770 [Phycisphaerae bacterium]